MTDLVSDRLILRPWDVHTVHANVERTNPASARVLEKAGFTQCGSTDELLSYERR